MHLGTRRDPGAVFAHYCWQIRLIPSFQNSLGTLWAYICILLELGAREITGYSARAYKNAELVHKAFSTVKGSLFDIQLFHTDRGSEFDNALIDELLDCFQISRSLSMKAARTTIPWLINFQNDQGGVCVLQVF